MVPGLVGVGQALENHSHWAVLAVSWGLYVTGTIIVRYFSLSDPILHVRLTITNGFMARWTIRTPSRQRRVLQRMCLTPILELVARSLAGLTSVRLFRSLFSSESL